MYNMFMYKCIRRYIVLIVCIVLFIFVILVYVYYFLLFFLPSVILRASNIWKFYECVDNIYTYT